MSAITSLLGSAVVFVFLWTTAPDAGQRSIFYGLFCASIGGAMTAAYYEFMEYDDF